MPTVRLQGIYMLFFNRPALVLAVPEGCVEQLQYLGNRNTGEFFLSYLFVTFQLIPLQQQLDLIIHGYLSACVWGLALKPPSIPFR